MKQTPFHYLFTRRVHNVVWTIEIYGNGQTVNFSFVRSSVPHWHSFSNGTSLHSAYQENFHGYICSRITALRFVACAMANARGGCHTAGGNQPNRPYRIWTPSQLRQFNVEDAKRPARDYDCADPSKWN